MHRTAVSLVLRGLRTPTIDSAYRLAVALNLSLSAVIADFERTQADN